MDPLTNEVVTVYTNSTGQSPEFEPFDGDYDAIDVLLDIGDEHTNYVRPRDVRKAIGVVNDKVIIKNSLPAQSQIIEVKPKRPRHIRKLEKKS
jgi:hypothetical protein